MLPVTNQRQAPTSSALNSSLTASGQCHILTGHPSGLVKLWDAPKGQPMQNLALLGDAGSSPVRSLVTLDQQLLCIAHADGQFAICQVPQYSRLATNSALGSQQQEVPLDAHLVSYQAHHKGLVQCYKCVVGLMSVGSSGTILMWSRDQLARIAKPDNPPQFVR